MQPRLGPAWLAVLTAAFALLAVLPGPAIASHVQCGEVIAQDTTLDSDLIDCPGNGIVIAASSITLDLNHHTVDGVGVGSGVLTDSTKARHVHDHIAIVDGTVEQFSDGIALRDTIDATVRGLTSQQNGEAGIDGNWSNGMFVVDSVVRDNGGSGVTFANSDLHTRTGRVEHSLLQHNGETGVRADFSGADLIENRIVGNHGDGAVFGTAGGKVVGNVIRGNGGDGLRTFDFGGAVVTGNRIVENGKNGIAINFWSTGARMAIRDNTLSGNALDGLFVDPELDGDPIVERNRARDNGDDGFDIEHAGTVVRANRAFFNLDLGIEAEPGVIDGGRNRARQSGDPRECVGVRC